jgi:CheY-like chemotaxis protein
VDLMLPGTSGFEVIEHIRDQFPQMPIIVYTGKHLSTEEEAHLNRLTQTVIVKDVRSPERLYDQVALWLHRKVSELPQNGRETVQRLNDPNTLLAGKRVLIVDDDVRNIFAMTSLLERHHMDVISAEQGETALQLLKDGSTFDIVLMDIMMPEMDGYEVMKAIRGMYGFKELPIIALTAKAMKGDREKCIDAGASDYISKPVDTDRLLTMLRTWLYR